MKKYIVLLAVLCSATLHAQQLKLNKGDMELSGSGEYSLSQLAAKIRLGTFVKDYLQVGADLSFEDSAILSRYGVGIYVQYLFETQTYLLPYIGSGLGVSSLDINGGNSYSGVDFSLFCGAKYFIADNVSLNTEIYMAVGSADTFVDDDKASSSDYGLTLGISYLW